MVLIYITHNFIEMVSQVFPFTNISFAIYNAVLGNSSEFVDRYARIALTIAFIEGT